MGPACDARQPACCIVSDRSAVHRSAEHRSAEHRSAKHRSARQDGKGWAAAASEHGTGAGGVRLERPARELRRHVQHAALLCVGAAAHRLRQVQWTTNPSIHCAELILTSTVKICSYFPFYTTFIIVDTELKGYTTVFAFFMPKCTN